MIIEHFYDFSCIFDHDYSISFFFKRFRFWKNSFLSSINVVDFRNNIKTSKKLRRIWNMKNFVKLLKFISINCFWRFDKLLIMSFIFFFFEINKNARYRLFLFVFFLIMKFSIFFCWFSTIIFNFLIFSYVFS